MECAVSKPDHAWLAASGKLLKLFYDNDQKFMLSKKLVIVSSGSSIMKETETWCQKVERRITRYLSIVAHKTGTSDTNEEGITAATNDIGVVFSAKRKTFFYQRNPCIAVIQRKIQQPTKKTLIADIRQR